MPKSTHGSSIVVSQAMLSLLKWMVKMDDSKGLSRYPVSDLFNKSGGEWKDVGSWQ